MRSTSIIEQMPGSARKRVATSSPRSPAARPDRRGPDFGGPAVPDPARVEEGLADAGELGDLGVEGVVGTWAEVVGVEPGRRVWRGTRRPRSRCGGEVDDVGRPELCSPLRRMNVIERVARRQPSAVRR